MKQAIAILLKISMIMNNVVGGILLCAAVFLLPSGYDEALVAIELLVFAPMFIIFGAVYKRARARLETANCKTDMLGYAIFDLIVGEKVTGILILAASDDVYTGNQAQPPHGYYQNPSDPYGGYYQNLNGYTPYSNNQPPYNGYTPYGNNQPPYNGYSPYGNNQPPYGYGQPPYNGQPQNASAPEETTENAETQGENEENKTN